MRAALRKKTALFVPAGLFWMSLVLAAAEPGNEAAPAGTAAPADAGAAPALPPATPAPGEEVMHPTQRGMRLTPAMARAMTRRMVSAMGRDFNMTPEQQQKLSDAYARRFMQTARTYQEQGQGLMEYGIEAFWKSVSRSPGDG